MTIQDLCFLNVNTPEDVFSCIVNTSGGLGYNAVFFLILIVVVGGFVNKMDTWKGMAVGGFLTSLIAVVGLVLEWFSVWMVMLSLIIMLAGLAVIIVKHFTK